MSPPLPAHLTLTASARSRIAFVGQKVEITPVAAALVVPLDVASVRPSVAPVGPRKGTGAILSRFPFVCPDDVD